MSVDIEKLQEGDIIRHASGNVYTVIRGATPSREAVAVRSISIQNAGEWAGVVRAALAPEPAPARVDEAQGLLPEHREMLDEAYRQNGRLDFSDSDAGLRNIAFRCVQDYHGSGGDAGVALGNALHWVKRAYDLGRKAQRAEDEQAAAAYFNKMAKDSIWAAKRQR